MADRFLKATLAAAAVILMFSFHSPASAAEGNPGEPPGYDTVPSRVIIVDHFIMGGGLAAGETGTAVFILRNTSETHNVSGVLVSGWIGDGEPVEFAGVNQAYVPLILPGGEVSVEFEYSTGNVDLTSIKSFSAGFTISYKDEGSGTDRTNYVSVRLPVFSNSYTAVSDADMRWPTPVVSSADAFLATRFMQVVYMIGLIACLAGSLVLLLYKTELLRGKR